MFDVGDIVYWRDFADEPYCVGEVMAIDCDRYIIKYNRININGARMWCYTSGKELSLWDNQELDIDNTSFRFPYSTPDNVVQFTRRAR